jgi:hypothetical protein
MKKIDAATLKRAAVISNLSTREIQVSAKIKFIEEFDLSGAKVDAEYERLCAERDSIHTKMLGMGEPSDVADFVDMAGYSNNAFEWKLDEKVIEFFIVEAALFGFSQAAKEKLGVYDR